MPSVVFKGLSHDTSLFVFAVFRLTCLYISQFFRKLLDARRQREFHVVGFALDVVVIHSRL